MPYEKIFYVPKVKVVVVIGIVFQLAGFFLEQPSPEPKSNVVIPMYEPCPEEVSAHDSKHI